MGGNLAVVRGELFSAAWFAGRACSTVVVIIVSTVTSVVATIVVVVAGIRIARVRCVARITGRRICRVSWVALVVTGANYEGRCCLGQQRGAIVSSVVSVQAAVDRD